MLFRSLRRDRLQQYLEQKAATGCSFSVVDHLRWDLRAIFRLAAQDGVLPSNPAELLFTPRSNEKRGYRWRAGRRRKFGSGLVCSHHQIFMITLLTVFHVIVCIFLILVVLLQQGKGADWAGAFGGGGSQTTFGARGAGSVLSRATTAAAILFMITSLALTIYISRPGGSSVVREGANQQNQQQQQQQPPAQQQNAPATPTTPEKK